MPAILSNGLSFLPVQKKKLTTIRAKALIYLFFSVSLAARPTETIEQLLQRGNSLMDEKEFSGALFELNKAMGILKYKHYHPLRPQVEEAIRLAKGKLLVARYSQRETTEEKGEKILPVDLESKHFQVSQVFGKTIAHKIWQRRENLQVNDFLGEGRILTVLPKSGIEIEDYRNGNFTLRSVNSAGFTLTNESTINLHSGACLIHWKRSSLPLLFRSSLTDLKLYSKAPFVVMLGGTTNGGIKVIALLGEVSLDLNGFTEKLLPGELVFALPGEFSRKMNVELSTLLGTSDLLTNFSTPPVYQNKLLQQTKLQALRTKKRFRTVVGDSRDRKNFELKVISND